MALTVESNKSQIMFSRGTVTANFKDSRVQLGFTSRVVRIIAETGGGDVAFSLNGGGSLDGVVKAGEDKVFEGMETSDIAFKNDTGTANIRVWAYK